MKTTIQSPSLAPVPGETSLDSKPALKEINARRERVASQGRELSCEMSQQRSVIAKKIPARFDLQLLRSPDQEETIQMMTARKKMRNKSFAQT